MSTTTRDTEQILEELLSIAADYAERLDLAGLEEERLELEERLSRIEQEPALRRLLYIRKARELAAGIDSHLPGTVRSIEAADFVLNTFQQHYSALQTAADSLELEELEQVLGDPSSGYVRLEELKRSSSAELEQILEQGGPAELLEAARLELTERAAGASYQRLPDLNVDRAVWSARGSELELYGRSLSGEPLWIWCHLEQGAATFEMSSREEEE